MRVSVLFLFRFLNFRLHIDLCEIFCVSSVFQIYEHGLPFQGRTSMKENDRYVTYVFRFHFFFVSQFSLFSLPPASRVDSFKCVILSQSLFSPFFQTSNCGEDKKIKHKTNKTYKRHTHLSEIIVSSFKLCFCRSPSGSWRHNVCAVDQFRFRSSYGTHILSVTLCCFISVYRFPFSVRSFVRCVVFHI